MVYLKHTSLIHITTVILPAFSMGFTGDELQVFADLVSGHIPHCCLVTLNYPNVPQMNYKKVSLLSWSVNLLFHFPFLWLTLAHALVQFKTFLPPKASSIY